MPKLIIADERGRIFAHPGLEAAGMKANRFFRTRPHELIPLPAGSRLFMLPHRAPVGYDASSKSFVTVAGASAVAAFVAPGYTATHSSAYRERARPKMLPLFSYAAVCEHRGKTYAAAIRVDKDIRHDCRFIDMAAVRKNIAKVKKALRSNRLVPHLATCALTHGCPNAQNFFLSRFEGPLPTSPACNAACSGCISYQPGKRCPVAQPRITFVPTPDEVAEVALFHIRATARPIVSFGQGCEGEPLLQAALIEAAIRRIRRATPKGTININTNGSLPQRLGRLFDAGLDSARISLNSARPEYYTKYYKPRGYAFTDVLRSIEIAKKRGFISLNYLTMPGFTDSLPEFSALKKLISKCPVDMIQWRNLNYDPVRYFEEMGVREAGEGMIGIENEIALLRKEFPDLRTGYFNPSKL